MNRNGQLSSRKLNSSTQPHKLKSTVFLKYTAILLCLLALTSCAGKPYGEQLSPDTSQDIYSRIEGFMEQQNQCSSSWDADILVEYATALATQKFNGYLLVKQPSFIKFIASNPLGQPLLAITTDSNQFQYMDVLNQQYTKGRTKSYALHADIPDAFISGQWGNWLAGRITTEHPFIIRKDKEENGVWVANEQDDMPTSHFLIEPRSLTITEQLLVDEDDNILARFTYGDFTSTGLCRQPGTITITELPFGTKITLQLSGIQGVKNDGGDFTIKVPQHYFIRLLP